MITPKAQPIQADKVITSRDNAVFQTLLDSLTSKGIRKHAQYMVFGERAVLETLNRQAPQTRSLLVSEDFPAWPSHFEEALAEVRRTRPSQLPKFSVLQLKRDLFAELDIFGTRAPILLVTLPEIEVADLSLAPQGLEILCALGDPANVGALVRSAAAFSVRKIVLLKESASPFHPKAIRAASAATGLLRYASGPSIHTLDSPELFALDMAGEELGKFSWPKNLRLLIGEEGPGLPKDRAFKRLSIPISTDVESLNAGVAAALALYSYRLKFRD